MEGMSRKNFQVVEMSKGDKKPAFAKISNLIEKSSLSPFSKYKFQRAKDS